jgi:hypothetical protein
MAEVLAKDLKLGQFMHLAPRKCRYIQREERGRKKKNTEKITKLKRKSDVQKVDND